MTNREFYKEQILDVVCDKCSKFAFDERINKVVPCDECDCDFCKFNNNYDCFFKRREWANSEYIEKPKLTENEKKFLDIIDPEFKYIARDLDGELYIFKRKPKKLKELWGYLDNCRRIEEKFFRELSFSFIKWEDREPWLIDDLKKLEIRKEDGENDN